MTLLARLRSSYVRREAYLVEMRSLAELRPVGAADGVEVRVVTEADVGRVRDFRDQFTEAAFRKMLADGDLGVYAWVDGQVAGHAWAMFARTALRRCWGGVDVARGEALLAWGHVRSELRGRRVWQNVVHDLTRLTFERGATRVVADLPLEHPELHRSMVKMGYTDLGRIAYSSFADVMLRRKVTPPA